MHIFRGAASCVCFLKTKTKEKILSLRSILHTHIGDISLLVLTHVMDLRALLLKRKIHHSWVYTDEAASLCILMKQQVCVYTDEAASLCLY